ncbi:MAG: sulfate adenylyltransferase subunit 2 [Bdellovibrionales bacterium]|nr:sulfate adenylyltransferase subunit 2 [Bdellovibrionales bacterium]
MKETSNDRLRELEQQSIFIIREAYKKFPKLGMLWSMGKDSTVMLWLVRKAFFGKVPFPLVHIDTTFKFPEMIKFRDEKAREWGINLIVAKNEKALSEGMNSSVGRLECCTALKTEALKQFLIKNPFQAIFVAIRRDEEGTRAKERYFSPRDEAFKWDFVEQPPELWDQYNTDFPDGEHVRVHPLLHWSESDIWEYIKKENIPTLDLYYSKEGKRYRSVGCAPCTKNTESDADTLDKVILELKTTKTSERSGRAQDQADAYAMQKLRVKGYM